jgi:hypothetical protein
MLTSCSSGFRNLCIDGGYDLCAEMYNKGVLSPLTSLVGQVSELPMHPSSSSLIAHSLTSVSLQISGTLDRIFTSAPVDVKKDQAEISKRKLVFDLAENVITILWCLR